MDQKQQSTTTKRFFSIFFEFLGYAALLVAYIFVFKDLLSLFTHTEKIFPSFKLIKFSATKKMTAPIIHFGPLPSLLFTPPLKMFFSLITSRSFKTSLKSIVDEYGLILNDIGSVAMWPFVWCDIENCINNINFIHCLDV